MPFLVTADLRGGRDGVNTPDLLAENKCQDAQNVDWYRAKFARRRAGSAATAFTGSPFTGTVMHLFRHYPDALESTAELWATDTAGNVGRLAGGTVWQNVVALGLPDTAVTPGTFQSAASLNGKLFVAYQGTGLGGDTRLKVWDPAAVKIRFAGINYGGSTGPTVVNTAGAGTYPAVTAYWRVRFVEKVGVTLRRSEPSASTSFTPSGANIGITITRPGAPGEGETHWELEVSVDNVNFYVVAGDNGFLGGGGVTPAIGVATTTAAQTLALSSVIPACGVSPTTGTYTLQGSYMFLASDQSRLLGFGDYIATNKQNRVYLSAVVGSLNVGDAERLDTNNGYYIDLDERDSGQARGLAGPINGSFVAFKDTQTWLLTPTGSPSQPYAARALSKVVGCADAASPCLGEDENGAPALYWMSRRGPYRYGVNGLEYIGEGVEDLILGPTSTLVTSVGNGLVHGIFYPAKRQVWFWYTTSGTNPNALMVYSLGKDGSPSGWSRFTGSICNARSSVMFANTVGASMSADLVPYIAQSGGTNRIWKCDTGTQDGDSTNYQAYVRTRAMAPWGFVSNGSLNRAYVLAAPSAGVTIRQTLTRDFGLESRTSDVLITAAGSETQLRKKFEDSALQGAGFFDVQIGDAAAANVASWRIDAHAIEWFPQEIP